MGHTLARNLEPTTWGGAQIETRAGRTKEVILLVELDELEGCARSVALLLGKVIELVETVLSELGLFTHAAAEGRPGRAKERMRKS